MNAVIILTPRQRCRVLLWLMRGYGIDAIARALDVPAEAVRAYLRGCGIYGSKQV